MYGNNHYLSKIERNANVIDKAPKDIRAKCLNNIIWARELSNRLEQLDYPQRQQAISQIHEILDSDYTLMGFELEQNKKQNDSSSLHNSR